MTIVIAPHPDDEVIGCGGALRLHVLRGDRVAVVFLTSGELALKHLRREAAWDIREREAAAALALIGIDDKMFLRLPDWHLGEERAASVAALAPVFASYAPRLIYLPHCGESHPDHQVALTLVRESLARTASLPVKPPVLRGYEVWTPLTTFDHVVDISAVITHKLRAIRCYQSQLTQHRYDRAARGLSLYRGAMTMRARYAEVFCTYPAVEPGSDPS